jgi:hypothetical protein
LRARVTQVNWFEQQNKTLRNELDQLKKSDPKHQQYEQPDLTRRRPEPRLPLASISVDKVQNLDGSIRHVGNEDINDLNRDELVSEYRRLEKKYHKLRDQVTITLEANEVLQKQIREKNETSEKWVQYAKTLEIQSNSRKQKIEKLKARLSSATANDAVANTSFVSGTHSGVAQGHEHVEARPDRTIVGHSNAPALGQLEILGDTDEDSSVIEDTAGAEREPSLPPLQLAEYSMTHPNPSRTPSSDIPIVVSERSVRKRRRDEQACSYIPAAARIKLEGSSPVMTSVQRHFIPHESVDFDNTEDMVVTPRKARTARPTPQKAQWNDSSNTSLIPQENFTAEGYSQNQFALHSVTSAHVQEPEQAIAQCRQAAFPDEHSEDIEYAGPVDQFPAMYAHDSKETKVVPWKPKSESDLRPSLRKGIANLAEDGNNTTPTSNSNALPPVKTGRLASLLDNTVLPEREAIVPVSNTSAKNTTSSYACVLAMPERRDLPFKRTDKRARRISKALETPTPSNAERPSSALKVNETSGITPGKFTSRKEQPLRERPLRSLKRTDFKLNPQYNEGYDYAFGDIVRGKDRASLPGCSKEECCGKLYRPLAELALADTDRIAINCALEKQLGDDSWKLGSLTQMEKDKMWVDAKIRELSQKHGRHRERHGGMREPPGWDRLGFPSTQEEAKDREEADQLELGEIELRHTEAIKKGKYLFRDEEP